MILSVVMSNPQTYNKNTEPQLCNHGLFADENYKKGCDKYNDNEYARLCLESRRSSDWYMTNITLDRCEYAHTHTNGYA